MTWQTIPGALPTGVLQEAKASFLASDSLLASTEPVVAAPFKSRQTHIQAPLSMARALR